MEKKTQHFKIVVPMYNVEKWIDKCIKSIKDQSYINFQCIIIDDISTDSTVQIVRNIINEDDRFKLIVNKEKKYALQNIYEGIDFAQPDDEDVIVTVDGDDWLYNNTVLDTLVETYASQQCWITYGNYVQYPSGRYSALSTYSPEVIYNNAFRSVAWQATHLRTFKYKLWKHIKKEDLLDQSGNYYKMGWDLAFMFPMLEMSGGRIVNINAPLYVYNIDNPLNDNKVDMELQLSIDREVRQKIKYEPIK